MRQGGPLPTARPARRLPSQSIWLGLTTLFLLACADGSQAGDRLMGSKAEFRLKTTDGRVLGPKDYAGKVVVIDFWATWCGPCRFQAKILDPLAHHFQRQAQFLATDVGEPENTVRRFLQASPMPYPVLLDPDSKVSDAYGILGLPTVMVVDREGRIAYLHTGITDGDTLKRIITQAGA